MIYKNLKSRKIKSALLRLIPLLALLSLSSCNNENNNGENDPNADSNNNPQFGSQNGGNNECTNCNNNNGGNDTYTQPAITATANLSGAFGLLVIDDAGGAGLTLARRHNDTIDKLSLTAPKFDIRTQGQKTFSLLSPDQDQDGYIPITVKNEYGEDVAFSFTENLIVGGLNLTDGETDGSGSTDNSDQPSAAMQKIEEATGEVKDALTQDINSEENGGYNPNMKLPKLLTIAVSPTREVYLHFQNPFIYRPAPANEDPWNRANGYQCQIFKIKGGTLDDLLTQEPSKDNLECIDNQHFIDGWRHFANGVFQFDEDGNVYYPGSIPDGSSMVVYKRSRDGSETSEVINANICVENFLITDSGGLFYSGQTCQQGQGGGGGGGFFRYVSPGENGAIIEIARDWWNFIYDTAVNDQNTDTAVFFGPDPRSSTTASWDSACLFNFDPSKANPEERISEVITCGNNIWEWMDLRRTVDVEEYGEGFNNYTGTDKNRSPSTAWKKEFKRRCETKDEVFAGGGSQISSIKQDSTGDIYVIGNIRKKQEGILRCSVELRGPHCTIDGMPTLANNSGTAYTESTCVAAAGTWVNKGNCSNGTTTASGCIDHSRTFTPGFCSSHSDYKTKSECEAVTGCSNSWYSNSTDCSNAGYNWGTLVWRTGYCSTSPNKYETEAACTGAGHTWDTENWRGSCTSTDSEENAGIYHDNRDGCVPNWRTETVWYDNVTTNICIAEETGSRSTWWEWNHKDNNFAQTATANKSVYADLTGKFLTNWMSCNQSDGSSGNWTKEYAALAKVNKSKKSLQLLSLESEKAIDLWLVNDKPFYSSFDTASGQYILSSIKEETNCVDSSIVRESQCTADDTTWSDRQCIMDTLTTKTSCEDGGYVWQTIRPTTTVTNFETYNLAESGSDTEVFIDGLDFGTNSYMFGNLDLEQKTIRLKEGLTGTLKTIVILPKN